MAFQGLVEKVDEIQPLHDHPGSVQGPVAVLFSRAFVFHSGSSDKAGRVPASHSEVVPSRVVDREETETLNSEAGRVVKQLLMALSVALVSQSAAVLSYSGVAAAFLEILGFVKLPIQAQGHLVGLAAEEVLQSLVAAWSS